MTALERVLVDVTNKVGVDINRAVSDSYYQNLLPFVCGLGPRKAQVLVKKIAAIVSFGTPQCETLSHTFIRAEIWSIVINSSRMVFSQPKFS